MERMISIMQEKLKEIGANTMLNAAWTKLRDGGGEKIMNTLLEKLKQLPSELKNLGVQFMGWFDKKFLAETRNERLNQLIHLAGKSPLVTIGLVLIVLLLFFGGNTGKPGKMMKAPGRNYQIPRKDFAANPKAYFRKLHDNKKRN